MNKDKVTDYTVDVMRTLAKVIDGAMSEAHGKRMGFSLIVFETEAHANSNYVSNCPREEVVAAYKELLKRWEESDD